MSRKELLHEAILGAAAVLGGEVEAAGDGWALTLDGEGRYVLDPTEDPVAMAPLHQLAAGVGRSAGRVHLVAVRPDDLEAALGVAEPVLMVRFEATFQSAAPSTHRFGLAATLAARQVVEASDAACVALAPKLARGRTRLDDEEFGAAWGVLLRAARQRLNKEAEERRSELLSLQSRRRREIEEVFRTRLMNLDEVAGDGDEEESAARLERERQAALDHAQSWFDPNRLRVHVRITLVLAIEPRNVRRRRGHDR